MGKRSRTLPSYFVSQTMPVLANPAAWRFTVDGLVRRHLVLTLDILTVETQKDLKQAGGVFFSLILIALANAAVLVLLFKALFPHSVSLRGFALSVAQGTISFWRVSASYVLRAAQRVGA